MYVVVHVSVKLIFQDDSFEMLKHTFSFVINRIYDGVEAETRKSQASF